MSERVAAVRKALVAFRGGRLAADELASWADGELDAYLSEPLNRYSFQDDALLEVYGILAALAEAPDARDEAAQAQALLDGEVPFTASRLLLVDPAWVASAPCAEAAALVASAGVALDTGEPWSDVLGPLSGTLGAIAEALAGDDYVELVILEAAAVAADLRFAIDGQVEVLGPGRPRIDAGLLAERFAAAAQVLRGERPFRAMVRTAGERVRVVLSY